LATARIRSRRATPRSTTDGVLALVTLETARTKALRLGACNRAFGVHCPHEETRALLRSVFSGLVRDRTDLGEGPAPTHYRIDGPDASGGFRVSDGTRTHVADDTDDLLYYIDKAITLALQRSRPDLFFLHAAALAGTRGVVVLPALPGTGKSTLTLALTARGFDYFSDELAPVDLGNLTVEPYAHAVCLKTLPPSPYTLPQGTLAVNTRFHVPLASLGTAARHDPLPLAALVFPRRSGGRFDGLRPLTAASAATRLMSHLLNGLAHPNYGLDAAIAVSGTVPCFELDITELPAAVEAIASRW
jgi:hypothetical protein